MKPLNDLQNFSMTLQRDEDFAHCVGPNTWRGQALELPRLFELDEDALDIQPVNQAQFEIPTS